MKLYIFIFITNLISIIIYPLNQEAREKGFVYLSEIDPTIICAPRYATEYNFMGRILAGYKKPVIIITKQAALALKKVQTDIAKNNYCLVVYDAYRPCKAVKDMITWGKDCEDQKLKQEYYPRLSKQDLLDLEYIAHKSCKSSHSRGSTVDVTIIKKNKKIHAIHPKKITLADGFNVLLLDDGTCNMGSSFDLFDLASHTDSKLINSSSYKLRQYLKKSMENHGFKNYHKEWWHFTLVPEPYTAHQETSYFNFDVA